MKKREKKRKKKGKTRTSETYDPLTTVTSQLRVKTFSGGDLLRRKTNLIYLSGT